jgi:hypothetical protein
VKNNIRIDVLILNFLLVAGCSTVAPKNIKSSIPSFDGNIQNSGIVAFLPDGGIEITPSKRDQYIALVADYGDQFVPSLKQSPEMGIHLLTDGNYEIDSEHVVDFGRMEIWKNSGR